jgi:hypothetical protein
MGSDLQNVNGCSVSEKSSRIVIARMAGSSGNAYEMTLPLPKALKLSASFFFIIDDD